jgi:enoyl-CoA hydratase
MTAAFAVDEISRLLQLEATPRPDPTDMIGLDIHRRSASEIAIVTLDRPNQHNALSLAGWARLADIFDHLAERPGLRVVVLRGAGSKAFSAGADIAEFPQTRLSADLGRHYSGRIAAALQGVEDLAVPVIAMIGGLAVGGGCELSSAADIRVLSADSRIGIPIGRLGVTLGMTETRAVARAIGHGNLFDLLASGRLIDARQALLWGFAQRVVDRADLVVEVAALVHAILGGSEGTLRAAKLALRLSAQPEVGDDHEGLRQLHDRAYGGPDLREGVAAFLEGRSPNFAGSAVG